MVCPYYICIYSRELSPRPQKRECIRVVFYIPISIFIYPRELSPCPHVPKMRVYMGDVSVPVSVGIYPRELSLCPHVHRNESV